jgi:hypothetical protein
MDDHVVNVSPLFRYYVISLLRYFQNYLKPTRFYDLHDLHDLHDLQDLQDF